MTKQIRDAIYYNNTRHRPISMSGKGLPHPDDFGLDPFTISTACWRGFYCEYTIREDHLWLTHLVVRQLDDYPAIDGVNAIYKENYILKDNEAEPEFLVGRRVVRPSSGSSLGEREVHYDGGIYKNLNVPAPLTGGVLLGIGHVDVPYIHYDFSHLAGYETILELLFEQGVLVKTIDHSAAVSKKRDELVKKQPPELPNWIVWSDPRLVGNESAEYDLFAADIKAWIRSTLTLNYNFFATGWLREIYP